MSASDHGQAGQGRFGEVTRAAMPERELRRLYLFRHGHVEGFGERLVRGQRDVPLSARGREEHAELVRWVARRGWRAGRVVASDLGRCAELARALAEASGAPLELCPELREQHMGAWQGRSWEEISRSEGGAINDYWDDYWNAAPPGGESMAQLSTRVLAWWRERAAELREERVFLVTHAGVIRALLCDWLGVDARDALRFAPAVASCTRVLESAPGAVLESLGERPESALALDEEHATRAEAPHPATPPRIALSGSAGTGKTTLGRALAERLGLPFIEERMRLRLEAGLDLHRFDEKQLVELVEELWQEQRALEEQHTEGFVADRSSLDYAAFWLHYGFFFERERTDRALAELRDWAQRYTDVLLFPHGVIPLVADGVRATNPWQQLRLQLLVEGLSTRYLAPNILREVPRTTDFQARLTWTLASYATH